MKITVKHCEECGGQGKFDVERKHYWEEFKQTKSCKKCKGTGHIVEIEEKK